jgi:arginine exporter protein ArgO
MNNFMCNLSDTIKGNLLIIAGIILLLHTLGITMKIIYILTLVGSIFMIIYGFVQAGYYERIVNMIRKKPETHV